MVRLGWSGLNPVVALANYLPCNPGFVFGPRKLSDYQMIYVCKGKGTGTIQGRSYGVEAGDLVCYGPGVVHRFEAGRSDPFVLYGMHFRLDGNLTADNRATVIETVPMRCGGPVNRLVLGEVGSDEELQVPECINVQDTEIPKLFGEIVRYYVGDTRMAPLAMRCLLIQLFLELARTLHHADSSKSPHDLSLGKLRLRLAQNADRRYDRRWLQQWSGYNEDYVSRVFRARFGLSPHQFHNLKKIETAKMRLALTDDSVTELAESLHYQSVHYFSRVFKAHTGFSPSDYRRLHRQF